MKTKENLSGMFIISVECSRICNDCVSLILTYGTSSRYSCLEIMNILSNEITVLYDYCNCASCVALVVNITASQGRFFIWREWFPCLPFVLAFLWLAIMSKGPWSIISRREKLETNNTEYFAIEKYFRIWEN